MDEELWQTVTGKEPLTDNELDSRRKEMIGEGLDELEDIWMNLLKFQYNMEQYDELLDIHELGATTTIAILFIHSDHVDEPQLVDGELAQSMRTQDDYVGEIMRYIELDDSLEIDWAGQSETVKGAVEVGVWT